MCTRLDIFDFTNLKLINFNSPIKSNKNIYISPIQSPIELEIDESKVLKIFLNNKNNWELWYELDMDKESNKLIDLLNILDNIALNHSIKKSKEWFNKELTLERLQKLFIPSYNLEKINNKEVLYMRSTVGKKEVMHAPTGSLLGKRKGRKTHGNQRKRDVPLGKVMVLRQPNAKTMPCTSRPQMYCKLQH